MSCVVKEAMVNDDYRQMFPITMLSSITAGVNLRVQAGRGPVVPTPEVSLASEAPLLWTPEAKEVDVTGIGQRLRIQNDGQDVWSATSEARQPEPDLYTDGFSGDGASFDDPGHRLFKGTNPNSGRRTCR
jgi:hypothetical protein